MAFETGVFDYVKATCEIEVVFPVDERGNAHIACIYCPFLSSNERMCQLNKKPVFFARDYVGEYCPLKRKELKKNEE